MKSRLPSEYDPWHMLAGATMLVASEPDEVCVIAALMDVPVYLLDAATGEPTRLGSDVDMLVSDMFLGLACRNPYTGAPMTPAEAIELCGFWRQMIDSNRDIAGGIGFAFWKQDHVAPLLWGGEPFQFMRKADDAKPGRAIAIWRARAPIDQLAALNAAQVQLVEVEDGFVRSHGLGADCVPPLSITVDRLGAYFDPAQPSELELLLQGGKFDDALLARARRLRSLIVEAGLGKYGSGRGTLLKRRAGNRRYILVPGQVEDDRAVQSGGCGLVSNLDLLTRVRAEAPDAYILYKPHPDVLAGHRRGAIPDNVCLQQADEIVGDGPISSVIDMVDEVHVNTSLAGFEALLRQKLVTTWGVPFYAGWGLTRDRGPVPARRSTRRTLDELVAAALLLYPRYLDPLTGLPCPPEILVERLSADGNSRGGGLLVLIRRLQGRVMRGLRSVAR